jgi:hypothetical protein
VVRHNHDRMNRRLSSLIVQTMPQYNIPHRFRQRIEAAAERNKHSPIVLLIMWQPPPISVFPLKHCLSHNLPMWSGRPHPLPLVLLVAPLTMPPKHRIRL